LYAQTRAERVEVIERTSAVVPFSALGRRLPVLYADPPRRVVCSGAGGTQKATEQHFGAMPKDEICALPIAALRL
jgi:hypothetical protein